DQPAQPLVAGIVLKKKRRGQTPQVFRELFGDVGACAAGLCGPARHFHGAVKQMFAHVPVERERRAEMGGVMHLSCFAPGAMNGMGIVQPFAGGQLPHEAAHNCAHFWASVTAIARNSAASAGLVSASAKGRRRATARLALASAPRTASSAGGAPSNASSAKR